MSETVVLRVASCTSPLWLARRRGRAAQVQLVPVARPIRRCHHTCAVSACESPRRHVVVRPWAGTSTASRAGSLAVPTDDGFWFDDDDGGAPVGPDSREPCPEEPIPTTQTRTFYGAFQDCELLAERQVFDSKPGSGDKCCSNNDEERVHHPHSVSPTHRKEVILPGGGVEASSPQVLAAARGRGYW